MNNRVITLTHYDRGPMRVAINEEHSWYLRRRVWTGVDTDGETFEDEDFDESVDQINAFLRGEREPARSGILMQLDMGERAP